MVVESLVVELMVKPGVEARVNKRGRIVLWCGGHSIPARSIHINEAHSPEGVLSVEIPMRFVTFRHEESQDVP